MSHFFDRDSGKHAKKSGPLSYQCELSPTAPQGPGRAPQAPGRAPQPGRGAGVNTNFCKFSL